MSPGCRILLISVYLRSKSRISLTIDHYRSALAGIRSPNLLNIFRKKVCCGVIFVGPCGEAIVDPRFLTKCSAHAPPVTLPKIDNPLFTIEKIIESELKTFASTSSSSGTSSVSGSGEESKSVSPVCRKPVSRSPSGQAGDEADEGFYDKPSISPTNSID